MFTKSQRWTKFNRQTVLFRSKPLRANIIQPWTNGRSFTLSRIISELLNILFPLLCKTLSCILAFFVKGEFWVAFTRVPIKRAAHSYCNEMVCLSTSFLYDSIKGKLDNRKSLLEGIFLNVSLNFTTECGLSDRTSHIPLGHHRLLHRSSQAPRAACWNQPSR